MMLGEFLLHVLEVANAELTAKPDRVQLVPGQVSAWDGCTGGQLSLRVKQVKEMRMPGTMCPGPSEISLGLEIIRCVSVLDDNGEAPSAVQITDDGLEMVQDMVELYRAISCSVKGISGVEKLVIDNWLPTGPDGGFASGEWSFTVTAQIETDG